MPLIGSVNTAAKKLGTRNRAVVALDKLGVAHHTHSSLPPTWRISVRSNVGDNQFPQ